MEHMLKRGLEPLQNNWSLNLSVIRNTKKRELLEVLKLIVIDEGVIIHIC